MPKPTDTLTRPRDPKRSKAAKRATLARKAQRRVKHSTRSGTTR